MNIAPTTLVFPWFTFENHELLRPWLDGKEMRDFLTRAGFSIQAINDPYGHAINLDTQSPPPNHIWFDVTLPEGWSTTDSGIDNPSWILDNRNRRRGRIDFYPNGRPDTAVFYCRYALWPFEVMFNLKQPPGMLVDVVVDRGIVGQDPDADLPIVLRDERPESTRSLDEIMRSGDFARGLEEEAERMRAGLPDTDLPILRMLHEKFPLWRDPLAYW